MRRAWWLWGGGINYVVFRGLGSGLQRSWPMVRVELGFKWRRAFCLGMVDIDYLISEIFLLVRGYRQTGLLINTQQQYRAKLMSFLFLQCSF